MIMVKCNCGFENPEGSKFCCTCGQKLDEKPHCANCGAEFIAGGKFCTSCGNPVFASTQNSKPVNISTKTQSSQQISTQSLQRAKRGFYEYFDRFRGKLPILKRSAWYERSINSDGSLGDMYETYGEILWHVEGCYGNITKDSIQEGYLGNFMLSKNGYRKWLSYKSDSCGQYNVGIDGTIAGRDIWDYDGDYVDITDNSASFCEPVKGKISKFIDNCRTTPIFSMIDSDNVEGVKQYIKSNPSLATSENPLPLLVATAMTSSVAMASVFIEAGADVNAIAREFKGRTALVVAACLGDAVMASFLLDNGAMGFIPCERGWLPLHYAASDDERARCLRVLLTERDINVNVKNNDGKTPLDIAREYKAAKCIEILEKKQ